MPRKRDPNKPIVSKIKHGPRHGGRPSSQFPEKFIPAARAMASEGKTPLEVREFLLTQGFNVAVKSCAKAMSPPITLADVVKAPETRVIEAKGLDSPHFTDDMRICVDDFIIDGREPSRICAWLQMEGITCTLSDVVSYTIARGEELARQPKDPIALETQRLGQHVKALRLKLVDIWNNMPRDKRYSERVLVAVLSELRFSQSLLIDTVRTNGAAGDGDLQAANEEIERKLGIVESEEPPQETSNPGIDTGSEPSGAEAPTGATV